MRPSSHKKPAQSRVMVLEFYGRSMHQAAVVIGQIVDLRNRIREEGDYARLSALEEFNARVCARHRVPEEVGQARRVPISVIIIQVDGDEPYLLRSAFRKSWISWPRTTTWRSSWRRMRRKPNFSGKIATVFSAIARRTSGFKINEDVVIPMQRIPDFALFLEQLNLNARLPHTVRRCRSWGVCPAWRWRTRISTANSSM